MAKILIADDERSICEAFAALITAEGHTPLIASNGDEAIERVRRDAPQAVFLDVRMPGKDGLATLMEINRIAPGTPVVIMTAYGTLQTAAAAFSNNAFDYLGKPLELAQARQVLRRALHRTAEIAVPVPLAAAAQRRAQRGVLVGQSAAMQEIFKLIVLLAGNDLSVLVQGESGVGKELVARAVHAQGMRASLPFVAVNCAAIPENLIESELFGHEKGAFTDAREARAGRFEAAGRGTLLLDEISEMPLHLQSKLLRVLQERSFERIGSSAATAFNARLIAASNQDLRRAVREGKFREDLYHRLNIVSIQVPPLRERREDIGLLVQEMLQRANEEIGKRLRGIEPPALAQLQSHSWPGNVRELEHVIKRSVLLARGDSLTVHDLQIDASIEGPAGVASEPDWALELQSIANGLLARSENQDAQDVYGYAVGRFESALVAAALQRTGGNRAAAAKILGISRATLRSKMPGTDDAD